MICKLKFELNKFNLQPEFAKATLQLLLSQNEFQGKNFICNQSQMKIKKCLLHTYLNLEPKELHIINNFIKHRRFVSLQPQFHNIKHEYKLCGHKNNYI